MIPPLLANNYLHYVFDLWAQQWRGRHANADVIDRCAAMAGARVIGVRPRRHEFTPAKTSKTTGGRVLIEWIPKLRDVDRRLKELRFARRAFGDYVFTKQAAKKGMAKAGKRYTYWGASTAWRRACERAGIKDLHFHDLRAKALTDTEESDGMQAARRKGSHSTEKQTSDNVRNKKPQKAKATR